MLKAIIETICLFLIFVIATSVAWVLVGCTMMVFMWDDAYLNPMMWPDSVFFPAFMFTLVAWLVFVFVIDAERHK